jgi:hypothetical protein
MSKPMYSITWHMPEKLLRLTWLEGTEGMTDEDFRDVLEVFADGAIYHKATRLVIDVRQFKFRPSREVLAWRDKVTVPKYNKAGTKRQAWIWPGDVSSMKSSTHAGSYEERYFSTEEEALAWLMDQSTSR